MALSAVVPLNEFGFAQVIEAQEKAGVLRVSVNDDIYHNVVHPDLRDLLVLDANGEPVPYIIQGNDRKGKTTRLAPVPFFPLMGDGKVGLDEFKVHITRNKKGDVKSVKTSREGFEADGVVGYLLDLNQVTQPVDRIVLKWQGNGKNYLKSITVSGSVNINSWQLIHDEVLIGRIEQNDHTFIFDSVDIGGNRFRQIHISWEDLGTPLVLSDVNLLISGSALAKRQWKTVTPAEVSEAKAYEFDTSASYPVDRVHPVNQPIGTAIRYRLYSKPVSNSDWQMVGEYDYYKQNVNGKQVESLPAIVPVSRDRFWKMEIIDETGAGRKIKPGLNIGWAADQILLKAEAGKEYTIAYGHAGSLSKEMDAREFITLNKNSEVRDIVPGKRIELAGNRSIDVSSSSIQDEFFTEWLKWLLLIAGLLILLLLAAKFLARPGGKNSNSAN